MKAALAWLRTSFGVCVAIALVFALAVGSLSGFGGPGYEIALVVGIALPSVVAICAAKDLSKRALAPIDALGRGATLGASAFGAVFASAMLHGVRVGFCDLLSGLEVLLLGPGVGFLLAGMWGWVASEASRFVRPGRRRNVARVLLALAGPIGCILVSLGRYYTSPIIYAYDPFVGYFSGTLYDTVISFDRLATYRIGSAASALAAVVIALHLDRDAETERARFVWKRRPALALLGAGAIVASAAVTMSGPALGHWTTKSSIVSELGGTIEGPRCVVVYDRTIDRDRVRLFADECESHVLLVEGWWGARGADKITAFLFTDENQKGRLMGASGTNIAKPWRAEVYVQNTDFPHRVIGHELMHVVAASHGRGPFAVAGYLGGYLPNPGLIEGVAVAASPKEDDLTPMEWAKTMKDLKMLPRLEDLFALGFLGQNSSMAYTVSGAFVGWIHDRYGAEVVRLWYGGASLEERLGKSMKELEALWHADLDLIELPEAARIQARAKFDRPGFFARRCPRLVDGCREKADGLASAGDVEGALVELQTARRWEPGNPNIRLDEAGALTAGEDSELGASAYRALADDEALPRYARDRAIEALADYALERGEIEEARARYEDVIGRTIDESKLRTLHVKLAATKDPDLRPAVVMLLLGEGNRKPDRTGAAALLGVLDKERPEDGLPAYLLARYFLDSANYSAALVHLDRALSRKLDVPRVRIEALRLRIIAAAAGRDCAEAQRALAAYEREPDVRAARVDAARRLVELCSAFPDR